MGMWDDVKRNLVDWYAVTSDKTSEVARITSLRYDKFAISRDIERQFGELGNFVYAGVRAGRQDVLADPAVHRMMDRVDALEKDLQVKDEQIAAVKAKRSPEDSATAGARPAGPAAAPAGGGLGDTAAPPAGPSSGDRGSGENGEGKNQEFTG